MTDATNVQGTVAMGKLYGVHAESARCLCCLCHQHITYSLSLSLSLSRSLSLSLSTLYPLSYRYYELRQFEGAKAAYTRALKLAPDRTELEDILEELDEIVRALTDRALDRSLCSLSNSCTTLSC
jgi:tetratricopeptide (TPR) repeat protein